MANFYIDLNASVNGVGTSASPFAAGEVYNLQAGNTYYLKGNYTLTADMISPLNTYIDAWYPDDPWRINGNNFQYEVLNGGVRNGIIVDVIRLYSDKAHDIYIAGTSTNTINYINISASRDIIITDYYLNGTEGDTSPISAYDSVIVNRDLLNASSMYHKVFEYGSYFENCVTNAVVLSGYSGISALCETSAASDTFNFKSISLSANTTSYLSAELPDWLETDLGKFSLRDREHAPAWAVSTYYFNINSSADYGTGTSADPFNYYQLSGLMDAATLESSISALDGDILRIKGIRSLSAGTDISNINLTSGTTLTLTSWKDKTPWKIVGDCYIGPYSIIVEDAIFKNLVSLNDITIEPYSEITFKSCIFYDSFYSNTLYVEGLANNTFTLNFRGCTFSADLVLDEYVYPDINTETETSALFSDCVFFNSIIKTPIATSEVDQAWATPYRSVSANNNVFTKSYGIVSAGFNLIESYTASVSGHWYLTDSVYDWINSQDLPAFENADRDTLHFWDYNLSATSADRQTAWVNGDYEIGYYSNDRMGPGAWYFGHEVISVIASSDSIDFGMSAYETEISITYPPTGHIGAFYFGPIDASINVSATINLDLDILEPSISQGTSVSAISDPIYIFTELYEPSVYAFKLINVNFEGTPRLGTSPLTVDFIANIRGAGFDDGKYKILEYHWYFDYGNNPSTYEITTTPYATHEYTGYRGKTFDVRLCVIIDDN